MEVVMQVLKFQQSKKHTSDDQIWSGILMKMMEVMKYWTLGRINEVIGKKTY